ncbi:MAG TPA: primosomal protein N' [Caulobacteraceae bacterium]|nr:primosomal protein N' [Caulobacteraceae bacterium]
MERREPGGTEPVAAGRIAQVLLPLPLPEAFDYAEPEGLGLAVGDHVAVPLGPRLTRGVVVALKDAVGSNRPLKMVEARLDDPPLPPRTVEFVEWAARYGVDFPGRPLAMAIRGLGARRPAPQRRLTATGRAPSRPTPARMRVLAAATTSMAPAELARAAGVSSGVLVPLVAEGALAESWITAQEKFDPPDPARPGAALNPGQAAAARSLAEMIETGGFATALLDGVTGSGKTEVYLEAVAAALARSDRGQVLVLLPEIALTAAVIDRFARRFGATPAQWHSGVAPVRRRAVWEAVARSEARVVVGARSALFLPFAHLALIVVDEEHDGAYKQDDGFVYQARDLAVARAKIEDCPVVLASATPSLETLWNAGAGRYRWLRLAARHGAAVLPTVSLIDLRAQPPQSGAWLSPPLVEAMEETLARGEQGLLFLNRRGYAPLVLCRACGERLTAPDTDSWLVEHRYSGRLVCHLTGFSMPKPRRCPHCQADDSLVSVGPGVERVQEEAARRFPDARLAVFSSDTVADADAARTLVDQMAAGEIDILVATQVAAKGHDFPFLTLVGVVDADLGLRGGDLRAAERTFQLLTQISGRAGRRERPGRALIQTWTPDHPVMTALAAGDRDAFVEAEMAERRAAGLPPFARLAAVILSGPDLAALEAFAEAMAAVAPNADGVEIFGPADAPLGLIRGRRRKRFLVRAERSVDLSAFMQAWRARVRPPGTIRLTIDIDPYSFL